MYSLGLHTNHANELIFDCEFRLLREIPIKTMTVTYTSQVSSCRRFGCFWKLLFRWRGSIYKLLWPNLMVYVMLYATLSFIYRFLLCDNNRIWRGSIYKLLWPNLMVYVMLYATLSFIYRFLLCDNNRIVFEKLSLHCQTYADLIPISFVLGFYVSIVIRRWWDQYLTIPWPDALAVYVSTFISGQDERARLMRRTIMRYANLSLLLAFRMMCPTVKKRFPTLDHLMDAGFLLMNEKKIFEGLDLKTHHPKYWLPLVWASAIARRARREGKVPDDFALKTIIDEIVKFRGGCGGLLNFDWISIPLVYTQVVTLAVYSYFAAALMGNQYLDPGKGYPKHTIDLVVPIFTFLQFFFYMGWLLVAETLVNPFGEDDDDFEINWIIDRNLQMSYVIVDEMHEEHPELIKDQYWDQVFPSELPYTEASKQYYMEPFLGSAFGVAVPERMQAFVMMSELAKGDRSETTPVLINGTSRRIAESLPSFQFIGSSLSLHKKKWKPFMKNACSQPYSVNSTYRFNDEEYQDDVFSMSGISMCSSRMQSRKFYSEKEIFKEETPKNPGMVEPDIMNKNPNTGSSEKNKTISNGSAKESKASTNESCSKQNEAKGKEVELFVENARNLRPFRTSSNEFSCPILPSINEHTKISLNDLHFIGNSTKFDILAEYKPLDCEIKQKYLSNRGPFLSQQPEEIELPKYPKKSTDKIKPAIIDQENSGKNNSVDLDQEN